MTTQQILQTLNLAGILMAVIAMGLIAWTFYTALQMPPKQLKQRIRELAPAPPGQEEKLPPLKRNVEMTVPAQVQEKLDECFGNDRLIQGWHRTTGEERL